MRKDMNYEDIEVPVYLINGFLDAGKTSFLSFTMTQEYFQIEEKTLLIVCEEGEEEYSTEVLKRYHNTVIEVIEDEADFKLSTLRALDARHDPSRVIIEYNPIWGVAKLEQMRLPRGWGIMQEIVIVDGETFSVYMNNMKAMFVEMARNAEMVLFNRCTKDLPLANFRRSIKVFNPACDVQFMGPDGRPVDIFEDSVPYDMDKDPIEIEDIDYGIFFVDMQDNMEKYLGKTVHFKGQVMKNPQMPSDTFIPARQAMTCCAEDIQYIGYLCKSKEASRLKEKSWVDVTAKIGKEYIPMVKREEPVLEALEVRAAKPPATELVYFT